MRAVYSFESSKGDGAASTARQLAESLSTLPLPEDYALQVLSVYRKHARFKYLNT